MLHLTEPVGNRYDNPSPRVAKSMYMYYLSSVRISVYPPLRLSTYFNLHVIQWSCLKYIEISWLQDGRQNFTHRFISTRQ